ncbi:MAG: hypothetical protein WBG38_05895, partial [Nodosilinea sp.]
LVFATYQKAWENDPKVLEQFDLRMLLLSLRDRYPALADLESQFKRVVAGLNRQDLYAEVTDAILKQLQPWYGRSLFQPAINEPEVTQLTVRSLEERCKTIAEQFDQSPDAVRLRKLIHCLCHGSWENDLSHLSQIYLPGLIQQVLTVAPKPQDLRYRLGRVVKHINRQQQYTRLANQVVAGFQPLYQQPWIEADATALVDSTALAESLALAEPSEPSVSTDGHTTLTSLARPEQSGQSAELTTLHSTLSNPLGPGREEGGPKRDRSSLFDLRGDIVQYANPLRAKILLYSCLHGPFGYTTQDWFNLNRRTLNELLLQTFEYCPTYADLDSKLSIISHCLGRAGDGGQVASAITRAMRAYYPQDPNVALESSDAEADSSRPRLIEAAHEMTSLSDCSVVVQSSARSPA